jgi:hypothetical protein
MAQSGFPRRAARVCVGIVLALTAALLPASGAGAAPEVPTGLAPNGTTVGVNPQLTWTAVGGATSYRVQIDDTPGFSSLLLNETTVNTTFTPKAALPTGELYWRVAAIDSSGESGFAESSFTKELQAPTPTAPSDGAIIAFPTQAVTFSWSPLPMRSYVLEIDDATDFIGATKIVTRATSYTMVETQANGQTFYWRVRGASEKNGSGVLTPWSTVRTYEVSWSTPPTPLTPPNNTVTAVTDVVISWTPIAGADHYELEINTAVDFSGTMVVDTNVESARYAKAANLLNGSYHWRVRAVDNDGHLGPWSDTWSFTRGWSGTPTLLWPEDGDMLVSPVRFEWTPVDHASHYELQVGTDASFSPNTFNNCFTNQTTFQTYLPGSGTPGSCSIPQIVEGETRYWRVRAIDGPTGVLGLWSQIYSFARFEGVFTAIAPIGGATVSTPVLQWEPMAWAEKYNVVVKDKNGTTVASKTTFATTFTPTGALNPANNPHTWTVVAVNHSNQTGTLGPAASFNYAAPSVTSPTVDILTPTAGASSTEMPSMTWTPVTSATNYQVDYRVAGAPTYQVLVASVVHAGYTHDVLLTPANYEFRVTAKNGTTTLDTSDWHAFTVGQLSTANLLAPAHCAPATTCDVLAYTPTMDWEDVPDAGFYLVYVARDANFTNVFRQFEVFQSEFTPREEFPDNDAGQAYYWHVRPCQKTGLCAPDPTSTLAPSRAFQKRSNAVLLSAPANAATVQNQPTFSWQEYLASNQPPLPLDRLESHIGARQYRIQVSTVATFTTTVDNQVVDQPTYTPLDRTYPEGPLYWRVRAIDGSGNELTWSETRMVTKAASALVATSPANGATVQGFPTFTWGTQLFASQYVIEVFKNGDTSYSGTNRVLAQTTDYNRWTASDQLAPGQYAWRLRREDSRGGDGPWASGGVFTVTGRTVNLIALADGATVPDNNVVFSWQAVPGAASYRYQQAATAAFQNPQSTETVMTSWAPTTKFNDGQYFWRIQALDGTGNVIGTSAIRSFRRDGTRPTVVDHGPSSDAPLDQPFMVSFSEPVQNVTNASFTITADGSTNAAVAVVTIIDDRTAQIEPDQPLVPGQAYTVALTDGITDLSGLKLVPFTWTVTTQRIVENTSLGIRETWARISQSGAMGAKIDGAFTGGARTRFRFTGTEVTVIGSKGPKGGLATVWIDGVRQPGQLDFYAPSTKTQQQMFTIGGLENRRHVIEIRVAGSKSAGSGGTWVWIDAFQAGGTTYQERHLRVRDRFATIDHPRARGGSYDYLSATKAGVRPSYKMTFVGTGVVWRGTMGPDLGKAVVYIDGRQKATVDLYSPDMRFGEVLFDSGTLSAGRHRIEIRLTGTKARGSRGTAVTVDYLEVKE